MGKADKYLKQAKAIAKVYGEPVKKTRVSPMPEKLEPSSVRERIALRVGTHQFPLFQDLLEYPSGSAYPQYADIPADFHDRNNRFCKIASSIFFNGGRVEDHGLRLKYPKDINQDVYRVSVLCTVQALLQSYGDRAPQHERKIGTVAWCLSEWYEDHSNSAMDMADEVDQNAGMGV
jgi:hypothetical protein